MSEVTHDKGKTLELKPIRKRPILLGQVIVLFGAVLLILAIVIPALLGPSVGSIFSNVVSNL